MATLTIKGIPDELLNELRRAAAEQRRSLNGEVLFRLERSLAGQHRDVAGFVQSLDAIHERLQLPALTSEEIRAAIEVGRA